MLWEIEDRMEASSSPKYSFNGLSIRCPILESHKPFWVEVDGGNINGERIFLGFHHLYMEIYTAAAGSSSVRIRCPVLWEEYNPKTHAPVVQLVE